MTYYSRSPNLHLKGDQRFKTGTGISEGCLMIIADSSEVQALRAELCQVKQMIMGMKELIA